MAKRTMVALPPNRVSSHPTWVADEGALKRYKSTLAYDEIKELARRCIWATVFLCEGFRIRPGSDANDFATLNQLKPGHRTPLQFEKLASRFKVDLERLLSHIGLNRPPKLDFETERRILEKVLGRPLNFSAEVKSVSSVETASFLSRGQSTGRAKRLPKIVRNK